METTFSETLAGLYRGDLELIDAAIAAVDREIAADADEAERFVRYFHGELHGNSVRAAERRADNAHHDRIAAVSAVETRCLHGDHIEAVKAANYGVGCDPQDIRTALVAARDVVAAKVEAVA